MWIMLGLQCKRIVAIQQLWYYLSSLLTYLLTYLLLYFEKYQATEQIESDTIRMLNVTYKLSAQQVTSCSPGESCSGGSPETAYNDVKSKGGIEQESDYPYTSGKAGATGTCTFTSSKAVVTIGGYTRISGKYLLMNYFYY